MKIKLCGIKREEDVEYLNEFLPDYAGFVFAGEKRRVTKQRAADLAALLDSSIKKVGVFVNASPDIIEETVCAAGLDVVQLHGDETADDIKQLRRLLPKVELWKAVRVKNEQSISNALTLGADLLLLDSFTPGEYGGTGKTANLKLIRSAKLKTSFFLAGGLSCENIREILRQITPYGVDISSGIETNGVKDREKIKKIMGILKEQSQKAVI